MRWTRSTIVLALMAGCSRDRPPLSSVEGRLIVNRRPAVNASVALHPLRAGGSTEIRSVGKTDETGTFRLTTLSAGDGAFPGDYVVTVVWPDDTVPLDECDCNELLRHDRFDGLYADPAHSPLRVTIHPRSNRLIVHAVQVTASKRRSHQRPPADWFAIPDTPATSEMPQSAVTPPSPPQVSTAREE